jgi:redox-sensitive bicupin YhaK (pirin superfamily)
MPMIIEARPAALELDGLMVGRVLPYVRRRMVGPFIFFDHMGPAELAPGKGMDVRPHPHIGLATVTYLFEGEIVHRDSLGMLQPIRPGEVNWMTAGRGIAHSERSSDEVRARGSKLHGIQLWVALPDEEEEREPSFDHYEADLIPEWSETGARVRLVAGTGWGRQSPVRTFSPLVYGELHVEAGARVPLPDSHAELALYVVSGALAVGETAVGPSRLVVLDDVKSEPRAQLASHVMLIGGAPVGKRHIYWNFVSSSRERIEKAKVDWMERRFPLIPGDEVEWVPLPEKPPGLSPSRGL